MLRKLVCCYVPVAGNATDRHARSLGRNPTEFQPSPRSRFQQLPEALSCLPAFQEDPQVLFLS